VQGTPQSRGSLITRSRGLAAAAPAPPAADPPDGVTAASEPTAHSPRARVFTAAQLLIGALAAAPLQPADPPSARQTQMPLKCHASAPRHLPLAQAQPPLLVHEPPQRLVAALAPLAQPVEVAAEPPTMSAAVPSSRLGPVLFLPVVVPAALPDLASLAGFSRASSSLSASALEVVPAVVFAPALAAPAAPVSAREAGAAAAALVAGVALGPLRGETATPRKHYSKRRSGWKAMRAGLAAQVVESQARLRGLMGEEGVGR